MCSNRSHPKILFVRPRYNTRLSRHPWLATEPLDLEYLAAIASEEGCKWMIHDPVVKKESFPHILKNFNPTIVAITGYYPAKDQMIHYAQQAKLAGKKILTLVGGAHAEVNHTDFHREAVDIVIRSGGANTFREILQTIQRGDNTDDIAGICHCTESGTWQCKTAEPFDPAALPVPDRSHFNQYREHFSYLHYGPTALVKTAYGCPFNCKFCYCRMLNNGHYSSRKPEEVVAEIKEIQCAQIWIVDDTFLLDIDRIRRFADLIETNNINKRFIIYSRSEFVAKNPEVIPLLKKIGVINVIIGFESICEDKLNRYNKRIAEAEGRQCIRLLNDAKIECTGLFIMDVDASLTDFLSLDRWIKKTNLTTYTFSIFTPYPGTEDFEKFKDLLITNDCRKWDLSHLVLAPTKMSRSTFYLLIFWMHIKMLARNPKLRAFATSRLLHPSRKKKDLWDFWATRYESLWVQYFSLEPTRCAIIRNIPFRPNINILDVGCGTGQLLGDLKTHFNGTPFSYTGIDQSSGMIRAAHSKYPGGHFSVASATEFHAPNKTYDIIICTHAFPYFPNKEHVLQKLAALLTDGGILLLAQASMNNPYDALMLSVVKLTTTKAYYPSRRNMRRLAASSFSRPPAETRISSNWLIPSIILFKWTKSKRTKS